MRWILNLVISVVLLLALDAFGWLDLLHDGKDVTLSTMTGPILGSVVIVAVILWAAGIVARIAYVLFGAVTFGLGFLAYPLVGWLTLLIIAHFMPGSLVLHGFWITVLCGVIMGFGRIPAPSREDQNA